MEGELGSAQSSSWLFLCRKEGCEPWRGYSHGVGPLNGGEVGGSALREEVSCGLELRAMHPPPPSHGDGDVQTDRTGLSMLSHSPDITLAPGGGYLCLVPFPQL